MSVFQYSGDFPRRFRAIFKKGMSSDGLLLNDGDAVCRLVAVWLTSHISEGQTLRSQKRLRLTKGIANRMLSKSCFCVAAMWSILSRNIKVQRRRRTICLYPSAVHTWLETGQVHFMLFFIKKINIIFLQGKPLEEKNKPNNKICNNPFRRPSSKQPVQFNEHESFVVLHGGSANHLSYSMGECDKAYHDQSGCFSCRKRFDFPSNDPASLNIHGWGYFWRNFRQLTNFTINLKNEIWGKDTLYFRIMDGEIEDHRTYIF